MPDHSFVATNGMTEIVDFALAAAARDGNGGLIEHEATDPLAARRERIAMSAALAANLARNAGYAVFPVRDDKSPACLGGFKSAAKDADAIDELWKRFPAPLIGVATGEVSDLAVLDLDRKHPEAARWWRLNETRLPATRTYRTRSGGVHLYFRHRAGLRCSAGRPVPGVDVRCEGGYIIFWFAGGLECLDNSPRAEWPAWLTGEVAPPPPPAPNPRWRDAPPSTRAIAAIVEKVAGAAAGNRNAVLFWAACRMHEHGRQSGEVLASLTPAALAAGLPADEARATIQSASRRHRRVA